MEFKETDKSFDEDFLFRVNTEDDGFLEEGFTGNGSAIDPVRTGYDSQGVQESIAHIVREEKRNQEQDQHHISDASELANGSESLPCRNDFLETDRNRSDDEQNERSSEPCQEKDEYQYADEWDHEPSEGLKEKEPDTAIYPQEERSPVPDNSFQEEEEQNILHQDFFSPATSNQEFSSPDTLGVSGDFSEAGWEDFSDVPSEDLSSQAARAAVKKIQEAKRKTSRELDPYYEGSGNAWNDGMDGTTGSILDLVNPVSIIKRLWMSFGLLALPTISYMGTIVSVVLVIVTLLTAVLTPIDQASAAVREFLELYAPGGGEFTNGTLSEAEIDAIIAGISGTESQKNAVRFALSRVGYPYSQDYRESGFAYDCSSFAYYSWLAGGKDISYGGGYAPTAAAEASALDSRGKTVTTSAGSPLMLQPGDLIFYGGSDNGRFMGIYHVAVYVGNGMQAEALGDEWGCVYQPVNANRVCLVCRP